MWACSAARGMMRCCRAWTVGRARAPVADHYLPAAAEVSDVSSPVRARATVGRRRLIDSCPAAAAAAKPRAPAGAGLPVEGICVHSRRPPAETMAKIAVRRKDLPAYTEFNYRCVSTEGGKRS